MSLEPKCLKFPIRFLPRLATLKLNDPLLPSNGLGSVNSCVFNLVAKKLKGGLQEWISHCTKQIKEYRFDLCALLQFTFEALYFFSFFIRDTREGGRREKKTRVARQLVRPEEEVENFVPFPFKLCQEYIAQCMPLRKKIFFSQHHHGIGSGSFPICQ